MNGEGSLRGSIWEGRSGYGLLLAYIRRFGSGDVFGVRLGAVYLGVFGHGRFGQGFVI